MKLSPQRYHAHKWFGPSTPTTWLSWGHICCFAQDRGMPPLLASPSCSFAMPRWWKLGPKRWEPCMLACYGHTLYSPALVLSLRNLHEPGKAWHGHESLERMARMAWACSNTPMSSSRAWYLDEQGHMVRLGAHDESMLTSMTHPPNSAGPSGLVEGAARASLTKGTSCDA